MNNLNRRLLIFGLLCSALAFQPTAVLAKDGDSSGSNSGSGGSGGDGSGSSGSGSGNGGSDDSDDRDSDEDNSGSDNSKADDGDEDNDGDGSSVSIRDHDRARRAVSNGRAVPLAKLRTFLNTNYPGKVVRVSLEKRQKEFVYRVRILQAGNRLKSLTLDARTLQRKWF